MDAKLRFPGTRRRAVAVTAGLSSRIRSIGFRLRRRRISRQYLRGDGLEIGALHRPLRVPASVNVRYVDRMDVADLRAHYPELRKAQLVDVDIIDDGETLSSQADASADFIIANHFIEHTEDPIGTVANHLRVLRPGGVLYLAVPDRHHTFDVDRVPTPVDHIVRDHRDGPAWSRPIHQEEWARLVEKVAAEDVPERVRWLEDHDYSIHFHVWDPDEFRLLLEFARDQERLPFTIEQVARNGHEFIAVLRRN
jgi:predicted SAM-dependent methyltransferase